MGLQLPQQTWGCLDLLKQVQLDPYTCVGSEATNSGWGLERGGRPPGIDKHTIEGLEYRSPSGTPPSHLGPYAF